MSANSDTVCGLSPNTIRRAIGLGLNINIRSGMFNTVCVSVSDNAPTPVDVPQLIPNDCHVDTRIDGCVNWCIDRYLTDKNG